MKKHSKKHSLSNLEVESFVTSLNSKKEETVKGGSTTGCLTISIVTIITIHRTRSDQGWC